MKPAVRLVLLDLDGTLADTAPDLAAAANRMRIARGIEPLPIAELRPYVSHGARGMVGRAFDVTADNARYAELRQEFLREYESALCVDSALFPGMDDTLQQLEQRGIKWGIVTNKFARFTLPLVQALKLSEPRGVRRQRRHHASFRSPIRRLCCTRWPQRPSMPALPCTSVTISVTSTQDTPPACVP